MWMNRWKYKTHRSCDFSKNWLPCLVWNKCVCPGACPETTLDLNSGLSTVAWSQFSVAGVRVARSTKGPWMFDVSSVSPIHRFYFLSCCCFVLLQDILLGFRIILFIAVVLNQNTATESFSIKQEYLHNLSPHKAQSSSILIELVLTR